MRPYRIKLETGLKVRNTGFTLIEVMIAIAIIGILTSIAVPNYIKYKEKARMEVAISEMRYIEKEIMNYWAENGELPDTLADIGMSNALDPWGRPYQYLKIQGVFFDDKDKDDKDKDDKDKDDKDKDEKGKPRKDHSLHPINSDFDLYSVGKDGKSTGPLTAKISQDDIVRANNGGFLGLVSDY